MKYSLRELRARYNLTQGEVAQKVGVSKTAYHGWESDPSKIRVEYAVRLAEIFKVSLDEIFFTQPHEIDSSENAV